MEILFITDNLFWKVRQTSHKPDEIYGVIERLSPGTRKIGEQFFLTCEYEQFVTSVQKMQRPDVLIPSNPSLATDLLLGSLFLGQSRAY